MSEKNPDRLKPALRTYSRFAFAQQLTIGDVAWIFQCDPRTVRAAIRKRPPEITFYTKFGRVYFSPEDVLDSIRASKKHAIRNSEGIVVATDLDKFTGLLDRLMARLLADRLRLTPKAFGAALHTEEAA